MRQNSISVSFDLDWFKLANNGEDSPVPIAQCQQEYRTKISSAELGLVKFNDEKEKEDYLNKIPACFFPIYVYCYLDANFTDRKHNIVVFRNKSSLSKIHKVNISGVYAANKSPQGCLINPRMCIQAYVTVLSECGALCREDIGTTTVSLQKLKKFMDLNLQIHSLHDNPTKSKVHLSNIVLTDTFNILPHNIELPAMKARATAMISAYVSQTENVTTSLLFEFMKKASKIKCPLNPSQVTFDNSTLNMPIASYTMYDPLETTVNFWEKEFAIAVHRYYLLFPHQGKNFPTTFSKLSVDEKCSFGMNMIVQYAQMLEYVGDYVLNTSKNGKESIEIFGDAITEHSGDCEDLSSAEMQLFDSFLAVDFSTSPHAFIFQELQRYFKFYVPFLVIEGVTSNNVTNAKKRTDPVTSGKAPKLTGAHGAIKFIPYSLLESYLVKWNASHPLTIHVQRTRRDLFQLLTFPEEEPTQILIGEGTGLLEAGIFMDPLAHIRQYVYSCPMMEKVKKPIFATKREISPFYQALIFGFTNRFIASHGIGMFHFATENPEQIYSNVIPGSEPFGRGVVFADFIQQKDYVRLLPNILPGQVREYSEDLVCLMDAVVKTRIPTPSLLGFSPNMSPSINILDSNQLTKTELLLKLDRDTNELVPNLCPLVNHCAAQEELSLLLDLIHAFDANKSIQKREFQGIIYIYLLEDYVDQLFMEKLKDFFIYHPPAGAPYFVGGISIFREYHDDTFYVYRCELSVYK